MKRFLILQLRPEDEASDDEFRAFLQFGSLNENEVHRVRIEKMGVPEDINLDDYSGVIVGGGPSNVSDSEDKKTKEQKKFEADLYKLLDEIVEKDFPFLGACYGVGILSTHQGACVSKEKYGEGVGAVTVKVNEEGKKDDLLKELSEEFRAFVGHKEACQGVPESGMLLASSDTCPVQMYRVKNNVYVTQFHPELDVEGIITRINVYKDAGYFPVEDAGKVINEVKKESVTIPTKILEKFVQKYKK
jgi:GMP synthase (glutamine-hydrolysing)